MTALPWLSASRVERMPRRRRVNLTHSTPERLFVSAERKLPVAGKVIEL